MTLELNPRAKWQPRCGSATVELAVSLPILLTIVMGTIEICQRIFVRQSATLIAYEGARLAARRTSVSGDVTARCQSLLTNRRINNGSVSISPSVLSSVASGTPIQVSITVPWAGNSPVSLVTAGASNITVNAVMVRE